MITTILFDADGVLITAEKKFSDHLADDLHISLEMTTPFYKGAFKDCLIGRADLKEEIAPFLPKWGWKGSVDEFLKLWFNVEHQLDKRILDYIQTLREKGISCYVATNQEKYRSQYMTEYMEFGPLFDGMFASNEIGFCKPDAAFFTYILEKIQKKPEEVLFWDDTQRNVDGAKELGIHAEFYSSYEDFLGRMEKYLV
jgi:putative hydrolase of the HAD superfamily